MAPLPPDHEEHAREVARQEVRGFARLFVDEVSRTPMRADGNLNARDFYVSLDSALQRFEQGETV